MDSVKEKLSYAQDVAIQLFDQVVHQGLIVSGKSEKQLNQEIYELAKRQFGIEKHWHKRLVRAGANTLFPYNENPPDLVIQPNDILFIDLGPIVEQWEADLGRTYVLGEDPLMHKLKNDLEKAWFETKRWFETHQSLAANQLFYFAVEKSKQYGWEFGGTIAGHLVGEFPHQQLPKGQIGLYIHPENSLDLLLPDAHGNQRHWILELHFVDKKRQIGGFFEQLLTL